MQEEKLKIGISQGDINGIGYEIILKTLSDPRMLEICTPIIYGSAKIAAYYRKALNIENFNLNIINSALEANPKKVNIINCNDESIRVEIGKSTEMAGTAAFEALKLATADAVNRKIDALVTAPINKHNIQSENFQFPGHTEYLESQFPDAKSLMIMVSPMMRIGVLVGHVPVKDIAGKIKKENIIQKIKALEQSLKVDFNIRKPRIAVFGLNPHAGDKGLLGDEEITEIIPAIESVRKEDIMAFGPFPADGFFGSDNLQKFDGILAMYHDQGLTPFKALCFENGINFTAGLPIVRTSPAHGTAYEISGKGIASPDSFRAAIYLAVDVCNKRIMDKELKANPLQSHKDKVNFTQKDEYVEKLIVPK
jgi:4-hydroxythreonine-4-phosphate dehydrogenase